MILVVCIYYMMFDVMNYVVCRYNMLKGVINSKEVRMVKAVGPSQSPGATSHHRSRQGAVEDTWMHEVILQCDAYYQNWSASEQERMSNHQANVLQQQKRVNLSDSLLSLKHWTIWNTYEFHIRYVSVTPLVLTVAIIL
jgi:hypothetical protein